MFNTPAPWGGNVDPFFLSGLLKLHTVTLRSVGNEDGTHGGKCISFPPVDATYRCEGARLKGVRAVCAQICLHCV
jgi:hypothetical protein